MICSVLVGLVLNWEYPAPKIISREEWGAKAMVIDLERHKIDRITVHHTGVKQSPERDFGDKLRGLQSWSQREDKLADGKTKPQWADIPYHYYIDWSGAIAECRPIDVPGDTNTNYDTTGHALVVVEGLFPQDYLSFAQRKSLRNLVTWLSLKYKVPAARVESHRDMAPGQTDCPGESLYKEMGNLREWVDSYQKKVGLNL